MRTPHVPVAEPDHVRLPGGPSTGAARPTTKDEYDHIPTVLRPEPVDDRSYPPYGIAQVNHDNDMDREAFDAQVEARYPRYRGGTQFGASAGLQGANGYRRVKYDITTGACSFASSSSGSANKRKAIRAAKFAAEALAKAYAAPFPPPSAAPLPAPPLPPPPLPPPPPAPSSSSSSRYHPY